MLGLWKAYVGREKKRGKTNLIPLAGYFTSSQFSVAAQDPGRLGAVLGEKSGCWDLHAKCSPIMQQCCSSFTFPSHMLGNTHRRSSLLDLISAFLFLTHATITRDLWQQLKLWIQKSTDNPGLCSFFHDQLWHDLLNRQRVLKLSRWKQKYKSNCPSSFNTSTPMTRNTSPEKCRQETKYVSERHWSWTVLPALPLTC